MAPPTGAERSRTYRCEGLTLRKASIGEADLVVTLLTADRGKVRAVAKGARRSGSRLVGHLEPLTLARLSMARGRELDIVTQAQVDDGFSALKEDLALMTRGLYVAELLDGFVPEDSPSPSLFRLALAVLRALPVASQPEAPLRYFEFCLLRENGMLPELYQCVECRREIGPDAHRFSVNLGGVLCPDCSPMEARVRPLSLRAMKVLRLMHRGSLAEVSALAISPSLAGELRSILSGTVRYWLGRDVRSGAFLERLEVEGDAGSGPDLGEPSARQLKACFRVRPQYLAAIPRRKIPVAAVRPLMQGTGCRRGRLLSKARRVRRQRRPMPERFTFICRTQRVLFGDLAGKIHLNCSALRKAWWYHTGPNRPPAEARTGGESRS